MPMILRKMESQSAPRSEEKACAAVVVVVLRWKEISPSSNGMKDGIRERQERQ